MKYLFWFLSIKKALPNPAGLSYEKGERICY